MNRLNFVIKIKNQFINNLPFIISFTILVLSFFYTWNSLENEKAELQKSNELTLDDFSSELKNSIVSHMSILETIMIKQWLHIENISDLYDYSRFIRTVSAFYNYSESFLAINWVNSSGIIQWVYPNENIALINTSVLLDNASYEAFTIARTQNITGFSRFTSFPQGKGFLAYIPIKYQDQTTGYFNIVFEITKVLDNIFEHEQALLEYSFLIMEVNSNNNISDNVIVSQLNEPFDINDSYVSSSKLNFYNKQLIIFSRPNDNLIIGTEPISVLNIFIAELLLCLVVYYLANRLKHKNDIIKKEYSEKVKMMDLVYRGKKLEALGTLSGGIAHDFNNILTNINGHFEIIKQNLNGASEHVQQSVMAIGRNLKRSKEITGQILAFSRQGYQNMEILDISKIINESMKLVKETADKRITFKCNEIPEYFVYGNQSQLMQIFMNILINSTHAIENYQNAVIQVFCCENTIIYNDLLLKNLRNLNPDINFHDHGLTVTIKDNGKGMDPMHVKNAFDPFYSPKETGKGTGLGLSIVYNNITALGGTVEIKSEIGEFTEVTINLPQVNYKYSEQVNYNQITSKKTNMNKIIIEQSVKRIMFIDDEIDIVNSYTTILKQKGYRINSFLTGQEAWRFYQQNTEKIDLVIADVNLPDISGVELIRLIKMINEEQKILMVSGFFEESFNFNSNNVSFLQKPFEINELLRIVDKNVYNY